MGKGDELWTSPNTFVASANCALYCGAQVNFVDIDPKTYNICPEKLEHRLAKAKKLGKLPKVIVANGSSFDGFITLKSFGLEGFTQFPFI